MVGCVLVLRFRQELRFRLEGGCFEVGAEVRIKLFMVIRVYMGSKHEILLWIIPWLKRLRGNTAMVSTRFG